MLGSIPEIVARYKGQKAITAICRDAFFNPAFLRGTTQFLMDMIDNPRLVHELIEMTLSHDIRAMQRMVAAGVDVVVFGDDYADKNSTLMSPRHFREFILPGLKRCVDAAHEAGAYVVKHTDGNIMAILDMIVDTGIDALNPIEPQAGMDIGLLKEQYGDRIALIGNIDCGYLLSPGAGRGGPARRGRDDPHRPARRRLLPLQFQQHPFVGPTGELHGHDRNLAGTSRLRGAQRMNAPSRSGTDDSGNAGDNAPVDGTTITHIRDLSGHQWKSGIAAWLGWLFDGLDMHLYTLVATPFVMQLLRAASVKDERVGYYGSVIQASFLVGWALGGGFFGRIGDRLGRARALMLTILTYALFTGLSFFAQEWWHLLICRFLAALGIGGEWAVGAALLSETWPKRWRPWIAATLQSAVNIGVLLATAAVYLLAQQELTSS